MSDDRDPDEGLTPWERTRRALHRAVDRICDAWDDAKDDADSRGYGTGRSYDGAGSSSGMKVVVAKARGDLPAVYDTVPATSVESIALNPTKAVAWLAELHTVIGALCWRQMLSGEITISPDAQRALERSDSKMLSELAHAAVERMCSEWNHNAEHVAKMVIRLGSQGVAWWPPPSKTGDTVNGITVGQRTNRSDEDCGLCDTPAPGGRNEVGQLLVRRIDGVAFHAVAIPGEHEACYWQVWRQRRRTA